MVTAHFSVPYGNSPRVSVRLRMPTFLPCANALRSVLRVSPRAHPHELTAPSAGVVGSLPIPAFSRANSGRSVSSFGGRCGCGRRGPRRSVVLWSRWQRASRGLEPVQRQHVLGTKPQSDARQRVAYRARCPTRGLAVEVAASATCERVDRSTPPHRARGQPVSPRRTRRLPARRRSRNRRMGNRQRLRRRRRRTVKTAPQGPTRAAACFLIRSRLE